MLKIQIPEDISKLRNKAANWKIRMSQSKINEFSQNTLISKTIEHYDQIMIEEYTDIPIPDFNTDLREGFVPKQSKPLSVNRMGFYEDLPAFETSISPIKRKEIWKSSQLRRFSHGDPSTKQRELKFRLNWQSNHKIMSQVKWNENERQNLYLESQSNLSENLNKNEWLNGNSSNLSKQQVYETPWFKGKDAEVEGHTNHFKNFRILELKGKLFTYFIA